MATDTQEILTQNALFAAISPEGVERLIHVGRVEYWPKGALLLEQGAVGPRMMVILKGSVEVLRLDPRGVQRSIAKLSDGEILGELSLLLDMPRTASVRALSEVRVFAMDRAAFNRMADEGDPAALRFGLGLSRVLAARLVRLNDTVLELLMAAQGADPLTERFNEARQDIFNLWDYDG
jgi:CRP-like cAMP-binding protein